ncbi:MAG: hypothetical protein JWN99_1683 [Ilumatobacteraceae bacterium]|nr:hypothetical protein [Ilumatobacteraceae bacterium]
MMIDDRLRSAADDLMHELDLVRPPVLPDHGRRPLLLVAGTALATAAAVVGLIVLVSHGQPTTSVDQPIETTQATTPAAVVDTSAQRVLLQARIADLQQNIDDLTVQINAAMAQADGSSSPELQVLQQEQSLAIRDVADVRGRLADLDLVGASPAEQRVALQARIAGLQQNIDDLTVQISSAMAQADGSSSTELQVLQQEQSLAIRDVSTLRGRLADLDIADADPASKRVVLQGRIVDLQQEIDDLTVQINALGNQEDQTPSAQLNVLQQQQSLAIRDLANARSQLADLDVVVTTGT